MLQLEGLSNMASNDTVASMIQRQLALNTGDIAVRANAGGQYQLVSTRTGLPVIGAAPADSIITQQAGGGTNTTVQAQVYNLAKALFQTAGVPPDLVEVMANLATFYSVNTGTPVTKLFKDGKLMNSFVATINNLRAANSQIGFSVHGQAPNWANNYLLGPAVLAAGE